MLVADAFGIFLTNLSRTPGEVAVRQEYEVSRVKDVATSTCSPKL
jgi:hypothetical protein